jgi:thiopurine S-methyltransferase
LWDTGAVDGFLDRAALVALPEPMRAPYVRHVASLLPEAARGLLVAFEFEPAIAAGPPFGVGEVDVRALYEPFFEVTLLERRDVTAEEPRFRERGANTVHEAVYAMVRRA